MDTKDINNLLERYNSGNATTEEKALVEIWYLKYKNSDAYLPSGQLEEDQKESLKSLLGQIEAKPRKIQLSRFTIAASILVFLATGVYWVIFRGQQKQQIAVNKPRKHDLAPGGNRAILTLSDGSKIVLNNAKNGTLATQGNTSINKTADGLISYTNATDKAASNVIAYNTASTPRGGQFQFVLSDGTKIWLNAASSIKYPVTFNGHERKVELTGEAYFEVAHNAQKPFRVVSNGQTVEVLGTHFNINAYSDEGIVKTTLLEGSVKVSSGSVSNTIKPGEQAQFRNGCISVIDNADLDATVSWKNGLFHFEDNSIQEVMRQLARWYDVDIKYEGQASQRLFSGEISRNVNASQILDILSFKKIHYKIEGKSIVITP